MTDNKKKIVTILSWGSVIMLVVALFLGSSCITVGTYMFTAIDNDKLAAKSYAGSTTGIVTATDKEAYTTNVDYSVTDDEGTYDFSQTIDIYTEEYKVGDSVEVFYNDEHPGADYIIPDLYVPYYTMVGKMLLKMGFGISLTAVVLTIIARIIVKAIKKKGYSEY